MPGPTARIALSGKRRTLQKSAAFQPRRRAARPDFEGASRFRHRGTRGKRPAASGRTKRMGRHRPQETPSDTFQRFMNSETKKSGFRPEREAGRKRSQAFASVKGARYGREKTVFRAECGGRRSTASSLTYRQSEAFGRVPAHFSSESSFSTALIV